jgi:serine/threonine protein kinase
MCRYRMVRPRIVQKVVGVGNDSRVAILRSDGTRVLKYCFADDKDAVRALKREQNILAILGHHSRITHLHSVCEEGSIFEYYPHGTLRNYYTTLLALPPLDDRVRWCRQAVEGIAHVHSKNILHNDISARNILLASDLAIKICDFGNSIVLGDGSVGTMLETEEGTDEIVMETAETRYNRCRPVEGREACVADDIFAIGSLFFEILTGKPPYDDLDSTSVENLYENGVFPPLDGISPEYAKIIDHCWTNHYTSIRDIEEDVSLVALSEDKCWSMQKVFILE